MQIKELVENLKDVFSDSYDLPKYSMNIHNNLYDLVLLQGRREVIDYIEHLLESKDRVDTERSCYQWGKRDDYLS